MLREKIVFGPVPSRRLGRSLGINLLPENGKLCNFDCIYCECGWNRDGKDDQSIPSASDVRSALENRLCEMMLEGEVIDSITFSGDGEPTLNPDFPRIVDDTLFLRDTYFPGAKVSVLSNATRAHIPQIAQALLKVDNPILKLDAPTQELAEKINLPSPGYDLQRTVAALEAFEGKFILQTMFLRTKDFDSSSDEVLQGWMSIVRRLRPRQVMAYTVDRPAPLDGIQAFTAEELSALVKPLVDEGFNVQVRGK